MKIIKIPLDSFWYDILEQNKYPFIGVFTRISIFNTGTKK